MLAIKLGSISGIVMMSSLLTIACFTPEPLPTHTPAPTATAYPTDTPYPTPTPAPTATAYPTDTPYPTPTPAPTATAYPTDTPYPTPTPAPTATAYPTDTPYPTPTPALTPEPTPAPAWQATSDWYRHTDLEQGFHELMAELLPGGVVNVEVATLDSNPTRMDSALYLTLGCFNSIPVGYISTYDLQIPANADRYMVGIWDEMKVEWTDEGIDLPLVRTDDGFSVYITNRPALREIVRLLKISSSGLPSEQYLTAGVYDSGPGTPDVVLWAAFDAAGVEDALSYLGCH